MNCAICDDVFDGSVCKQCRADAALGRAVRRMESAGLWSGIYGWFVLNKGLPWCGKRRSSHGNTPEAALRAAGLMEEEGEVT